MTAPSEDPFREAPLPKLAPALFRKRTGKDLDLVVPSVVEMYRPEWCTKYPLRTDDPHRARKLGNIGHISYHSIPKLQLKPSNPRAIALFGLALLWLFAYPTPLKLRTLMCASGYSLVESTFTLLERGRNYTSLAQFCCNLIYIPILLDLYFGFFLNSFSNFSGVPWGPVVAILAFPLNVWLLEVVQGYFIIWLYGHNVAWNYLDYDDSYFHGAARLGHAPCWVGLGAICWL
eukprot:CAMPEP_0206569440 /NCGR_PEP_ID=MMETSP0325_2-20121206/26440_1 /ASSEMBLY_ACC=CAM_ASM_000347 /TAXON_ID=2866 /ORGANISM="Crypthecodinium cohnii, Strain Seligo" /LENGTH=231 /DNA_ID=CAMNT_0054073031 /DNA_START=73 /DNA_END=765 /DNA_ORIENTATION=+